MKATPFAVGVDNGGTWIRIVGLDRRGRRLWSLKKPSPTVHNLPAFLRAHLRHFKGGMMHLAVGSRAVWKKTARRSMARALKGLAKHIEVTSDVEAAWLAAFEHPHPHPSPLSMERGAKKSAPSSRALSLLKGEGRSTKVWRPGEGDGIVVIAGTGSIAYGRTSRGRSARAGGLGPEKGDEGSGYWIGREWLASQGKRPEFKAAQVRRIAALAPGVLARAHRGDPIALLIVRLAQWELAKLVKALALKFRTKTVHVACAGSVFQNTWFRSGFFRALSPLHAKFQPPRTDAATALARSIMTHGLD